MTIGSDVPLQILCVELHQVRLVGTTFTGLIDSSIMPARRLNNGVTGGFLCQPTRPASQLIRNPIEIAVLVQPLTAPLVGNQVRFDITLQIAKLPYTAPTTSLTVSCYAVFQNTSTNATLFRLINGAGSHIIWPAETVQAGDSIAIRIQRPDTGNPPDDTFIGDILLGETVQLDFTNQDVVLGTV